MSEDKKEAPREYAVGYGRPPKKGQFKKGNSGNPGGRPRTRNTAIDIPGVLDDPVNVIQDGVVRTRRQRK